MAEDKLVRRILGLPDHLPGTKLTQPAEMWIGYISAIDYGKGFVKVTFPLLNDTESDWLQVLVPFTRSNKAFFLPDLNDQVLCIMDENFTTGYVAGAMYSGADVVPGETNENRKGFYFATGDLIDYDDALRKLRLKIAKIDLGTNPNASAVLGEILETFLEAVRTWLSTHVHTANNTASVLPVPALTSFKSTSIKVSA